jgi:hypothetical protein
MKSGLWRSGDPERAGVDHSGASWAKAEDLHQEVRGYEIEGAC